MFTKTRRFLIFFLLAFACVLLVGCGGEEVPVTPELKAPTEIKISIDYAPTEPNATTVDGEDIELSIEVEDGVDPSVTWESKNPEIATVDEKGVVKAVAIGKATIVATSKLAPNVEDEVEIYVHPKSVAQLLKEASDYVKEHVLYINGYDEKTKLPTYKTNLLTYSYKNVKSNEVYKGNYYRPAADWEETEVDSIDTIKCTITYEPTKESTEIILTIYVVKDVEENDFNTVFAARDAILALFKDEDLTAYEKAEKALAIEKSSGVAIQWATSNSNILKLSQTAGLETADDKTDDEFKVEYIKPLDNTEVTLTATVMSAGVYGETVPVEIVAKGYSNEDKLNYFKTEVCANIPAESDIVRRDIKLPTNEAKFDMKATWTSDHPELLDGAGVYTDDENGNAEVGVKVKLTATVVYLGANEESNGEGEFTDKNSFRGEISFTVTVYPCTDAARAVNKAVAYAKTHIGDGHGWFPWGKLDRASNQLTGLPATLGEAGVTGDWANIALTWRCSEEGLFDNEWNLLKQYLRYHEVKLLADVTLGSANETIEVPLNVGIAQKERTSHIGGSFSRLAVQTTDTITVAFDALQTLSGFDDRIGTQQVWYKGDNKGALYEVILGASEDLTRSTVTQPAQSSNDAYKSKPITPEMQFGIGVNGGFGGVTFYWDDEESGVRFQYYATEAMTWVITDADIDENGNLKDNDGDGILSMLRRKDSNYDHILFVNISSKEVRIPVAYATSSKNTTYTPGTDVYPLSRAAWSRQVSLTIDGYKPASVIQADGTVGCIAAEEAFSESLLLLENGATVNDETVYAQYLSVPKGGFIWSAFEAQDDAYTAPKSTTGKNSNYSYLTKMLCTAGNKLTVEFWYVHPCNTLTTSQYWTNQIIYVAPDESGNGIGAGNYSVLVSDGDTRYFTLTKPVPGCGHIVISADKTTVSSYADPNAATPLETVALGTTALPASKAVTKMGGFGIGVEGNNVGYWAKALIGTNHEAEVNAAWKPAE